MWSLPCKLDNFNQEQGWQNAPVCSALQHWFLIQISPRYRFRTIHMANFMIIFFKTLFVGKILVSFYFENMYCQPEIVANFMKIIKTNHVALILRCRQETGIFKPIFIVCQTLQFCNSTIQNIWCACMQDWWIWTF